MDQCIINNELQIFDLPANATLYFPSRIHNFFALPLADEVVYVSLDQSPSSHGFQCTCSMSASTAIVNGINSAAVAASSAIASMLQIQMLLPVVEDLSLRTDFGLG